MDILKNNKKKESDRHSSSKSSVLKYLAKSIESPTIPEIAEYLNISVPTGTKVVMDLVNDGYIVNDGKRVVENGRKPTQYRINQEKFYVVGVEVLSKWIHVSIRKPNLESVHEQLSREFVLEDSPACLDFIETFISKTIEDSKISKENIIGVGVGMIGDIDVHVNQPSNYYSELSDALTQHLKSRLDLPVVIDNDTRAIAIAEQTIGAAKDFEDALIVKVSRSLGIAMIVGGTLVSGTKGFAGNLAHMQFNESKNRLCVCGKTGCLGTEIGGTALKNELEESLKENKTSIKFDLETSNSSTYHQILEAAQKGDGLSVKLIQDQGEKLGAALGNILNLLNPELVVIGGEFVMVMDIFMDAVKMGIRKSALLDSLNNCEIRSTTLGRYLSSKAGACLMLKSAEMIDY